MKKKINTFDAFLNHQEANYIKKVVLKGFLTENIETKKFEKNFSKKFKMKNALAISNWTAGLFATLKAINIKKGDEVIIPNLTFFATASPIILCGAKIVLCDVELDNFSLDLNILEKKITKKTKCIIPVHLSGFCCDMDRLKSICKKKNIYLIEDSAQALGATYKNKNLGNFGDLSGFSFFGNKIMTTGEGGMIIAKKKSLLKKVYLIKNHGRDKTGIFKHKTLGFNFMFTEMQAAIGNIQLKKFNYILKKKKNIFSLYFNKLKDIKEIHFPKPIKNNTPNYWTVCVFVNIHKKKLKDFLEHKNIQIRDNFFPINLQPALKFGGYLKNGNDNFKNSIKIYKNTIILPSNCNLKVSEIEYICEQIKTFYSKKIL